MIDWGRFTRADLARAGFVGFEPVASLRLDRCRSMPAAPGVYKVLRTTRGTPAFLARTTGGRFKGRDKTVPVDLLAPRWVAGTDVVYIGKASSLRSRVRLLVDYGGGKPVGHQGGYPLWQVHDSDALLVAWLEEPAFTALENQLIASFAATFHGRLPYANTAGPRSG